MEKKREVIGSMYPEKLTFGGERLRTTRINEAAHIIYRLDKAFSENEKGQSEIISALSSQVGMTGLENLLKVPPIGRFSDQLSKTHRLIHRRIF